MTTDELAEKIASQIFYHQLDIRARDSLAELMRQFAEEIIRRSIEP